MCVGPHQTFWFVERKGVRNRPHNNHVAVYATRYQELYKRLGDRNLIMAPHAREQFRFCDIVDPGTGELLLTFEHEVRSLLHAEYRRPLVNRIPLEYPVD